MPGIVAEAALPTGIWIGETPEPFGSWSFGCAIAQLSSARITLQIGMAESARGTVIFGANEPVPPVDPEREYPPGISEERARCLTFSALEGFPYTLHDGRIDDNGRFHFSVAAGEPYESWCAGQTSLPFIEAVTGYTCLPYGLPRYREMCLSDAECASSLPKYALCDDRACTCVEERCVANLTLGHRFDLQISGDTMRGVISHVGSDGGAVEVVLRKVQ